MKVKKVTINNFKRFADLTIHEIGRDVRLVVMLGRNGTGKTSVFEAMNLYNRKNISTDMRYNPYYNRDEDDPSNSRNLDIDKKIKIEFHDTDEYPKEIFHIRTAFRHTEEVDDTKIRIKDDTSYSNRRLQTMYNEDTELMENFSRINTLILQGVTEGPDQLNSHTIDDVIGGIKRGVENLIDGLTLDLVGKSKCLVFNKGAIKKYPYENLSSGERAALDLIVDLEICKKISPNSIVCIDEPESHIALSEHHKLVDIMLNCISTNTQIWIATHSIGILRAAMDIHRTKPNEVAFINFNDKDFDMGVIISPMEPSRDVWGKAHKYMADDLARLIFPDVIVLCESDAGFDEACYGNIFNKEFPHIRFLSCGSKHDLKKVRNALERLELGIEVLFCLRDRDNMERGEIEDEIDENAMIVLEKTDLEGYLIDDEAIDSLCNENGITNIAGELKDARNACRGDSKEKAKKIHQKLRELIPNNEYGDNYKSFLRYTMSKHIRPGSNIYAELKETIIDRCLGE